MSGSDCRLPRLAHDNPEAVVLLTQPVILTTFNCHLCGERLTWLTALGVDRHRSLVVPTRVTNTYDEAVSARQYCLAHGITRPAVVTSPYHTRRALATFRTVFRQTPTAIGVHAAADSPAQPGEWWATPYDRFYVRYEWAALVWNTVGHGINPFASAS